MANARQFPKSGNGFGRIKIMEAIFELLFQFVFEIVLEIAAELLFAFGFESIASTMRKGNDVNPVLGGIGYVLFGAVLGALSWFILPEPFVKSDFLRAANFIFSPVILGFSLCLFSWFFRRKAKGEGIFSLKVFLFGVLFAVSYSITRAGLISQWQ